MKSLHGFLLMGIYPGGVLWGGGHFMISLEETIPLENKFLFSLLQGFVWRGKRAGKDDKAWSCPRSVSL